MEPWCDHRSYLGHHWGRLCRQCWVATVWSWGRTFHGRKASADRCWNRMSVCRGLLWKQGRSTVQMWLHCYSEKNNNSLEIVDLELAGTIHQQITEGRLELRPSVHVDGGQSQRFQRWDRELIGNSPGGQSRPQGIYRVRDALANVGVASPTHLDGRSWKGV